MKNIYPESVLVKWTEKALPRPVLAAGNEDKNDLAFPIHPPCHFKC